MSIKEVSLHSYHLTVYRYRLRPKVLIDVSDIDTRVELFGGWVEFPICVAPTAFQRMAHEDGEAATAKGTIVYFVW